MPTIDVQIKPKLTKLYTEQLVHYDESLTGPGNMRGLCHQVWVQVRQWSGQAAPDTVLECIVHVDGEKVFEKAKLMPRDWTKAQCIREGIKVFDQQAAQHPFFYAQPTGQNGTWSFDSICLAPIGEDDQS